MDASALALPVADEGVIFNQHGLNEVATLYSRESPAVQRLELEANSAEISKELTEKAHSLVGSQDS